MMIGISQILTWPGKHSPSLMLDWMQKARSKMSRRRFKTEEIIQHLRTHELNLEKGMTQDQSAKSIGVAYQSLVRWKKEYGGLRVDQAKKLKDLEKENIRLKRLLADAELDKSILKEALEGNY
jgi:putative transposase